MTLPSGFVETQVATGLTSPTAIHALPDGRVLINEQDGRVRMIKNGALLPTPVTTFSVDTFEERGLLGVASDPGFLENQYLYFYYTIRASAVPDGKPRNRLVRVTLTGDTMVPNSEVRLVDFPEIANGIRWHMGGHLEFGPDGMLYVGQGIHEDNSTSQNLSTPRGKMLRFNVAAWAGQPEDLIPVDNPFLKQTTGINRAIWAIGLRNPFSFAIQKSTGRLWANDVGSEWNGVPLGGAGFKDGWEEVNDVVKGGNYGWPLNEGYAVSAGQRAPLYAYGHRLYPGATDGFSDACTIGGAFYEPAVKSFPAAYHGKYFFADMIYGWIRTMDPASADPKATVANFGTVPSVAQSNFPTGLYVDEGGNLWVLSRGRTADGNIGSGQGRVLRISYQANSAPVVGTPPESRHVAAGENAEFHATVYGNPPFTYQWLLNGSPMPTSIPSATQETLLFPSTLADNGAQISLRVSNTAGSATSTPATLSVAAGSRPVINITSPTLGATYKAGDVIRWQAVATDADDGPLAPAALTWRVFFRLHVDHPFRLPVSGQNQGSFEIPPESPGQSDVYFILEVTARDSSGLASSLQRIIRPSTQTFTLTTSPPGLTYELDSVPRNGAQTFTGVVGVIRHLAAPAEQSFNGQTYRFDHWSHGEGLDHRWATAPTPTTLTAVFRTGTALTPLDTWRQSLLGTWINTGDAADDADPDGDGWPNLLEYRQGFQPRQFNAPLRPLLTTQGGTAHVLAQISLAPNITGITIIGETSDSLAAGSWSSTSTVTSQIGSVLTVRDTGTPTPERPRFLRLKATR